MRYLYLLVLFISLSIHSIAQDSRAKAFEIARQFDIYVQVFQKLNQSYVDEIQVGDLNTIAIEAMLRSLDPYTVFMPEAEIDKYELLQTGQYAGLGIRSFYASHFVVVSEILEHSPAAKAGLMVGDSIFEVDGHRVSQYNEEDLSALIRGEAGSVAHLRIRRYNSPDTLSIDAERQHIKVEQVPYCGMLNASIAYLKLNTFSKNSAQQVKTHLQSLIAKGAKALIFDLRGNGGGLLQEAVDIMSLFVPKAQMVVEMKSRTHSRNHKFVTQQTPIAVDMPLVFLIDKHSASAAEILSGAAQDLDRAVIVGEQSFGKGLVQNIVPLSFGAQIKLTMAKYYIPSGRCVQAIDYSHSAKTLVRDNKPFFYTIAGRPVYEGQGISPDIAMKEDAHLSLLSKQLKDSLYLFKYANRFVQSYDSIAAPKYFSISEEVWKDFKHYLHNQNFELQLPLEAALDSLQYHLSVLKKASLCDLSPVQQMAKEEKQRLWQESETELKHMLAAEICQRYYYQKGALQARMPYDVVIAKAIEVLQNKIVYNKILSPQ